MQATSDLIAVDDDRPTAALRRKARADGERSKQAAIAAYRACLLNGLCFRPSIDDLKVHKISRKIVQRHFGTLEALKTAALDEATRAGILKVLMPNGPWPAADDCDRIVNAVVFGGIF
jgi:hypothetical protein